LTAAEAADGIAHEKDLSEVIAAQGGAPECLAGTELASDRYTHCAGPIQGKGMDVRGVRVLFPSAGTVELILEFIFSVCCSPGEVAGRELLCCTVRSALVARCTNRVDCRAGGGF